MRRLVLLAVLFGTLATPAGANQWKVRDLTVDPASEQSKLMLVVSKTSITVVRRANDTVEKTIDPKDVVSIWYDDKIVAGSLGREWVTFIFKAYESGPRSDEDILGALAMLAVAGAGYLVAEPFSKRQHAVNIRYRDGERIEWLTLGITWFDHVWLMTDLSNVTGLKWLNMPLQRTKLFWSIDDHTCRFESWSATGNVPVPAGISTTKVLGKTPATLSRPVTPRARRSPDTVSRPATIVVRWRHRDVRAEALVQARAEVEIVLGRPVEAELRGRRDDRAVHHGRANADEGQRAGRNRRLVTRALRERERSHAQARHDGCRRVEAQGLQHVRARAVRHPPHAQPRPRPA